LALVAVAQAGAPIGYAGGYATQAVIIIIGIFLVSQKLLDPSLD